jgi:hypothetical protein
MTIENANDWAIDHGYHEIETDTGDEFVAWQSMDNEDENGAPMVAFCGVKAWRDYAFDERFVAVLCWENGETYGQRGYGRTMLEALQDLAQNIPTEQAEHVRDAEHRLIDPALTDTPTV